MFYESTILLGLFCEICADGFVGDATVGTSADCSVCPCYEPRVVNATCETGAESQIVCSFCAEGYVGDKCDRYLTVESNINCLYVTWCTITNLNSSSGKNVFTE